jgi:hypothetical protein
MGMQMRTCRTSSLAESFTNVGSALCCHPSTGDDKSASQPPQTKRSEMQWRAPTSEEARGEEPEVIGVKQLETESCYHKISTRRDNQPVFDRSMQHTCATKPQFSENSSTWCTTYPKFGFITVLRAKQATVCFLLKRNKRTEAMQPQLILLLSLTSNVQRPLLVPETERVK